VNRELNLATVTHGSQVILPFYPLSALAIGLLFILQPASRTSSGAFETAKEVMSIPTWGLVFILVGLLEIMAFAVGRTVMFQWGLIIGAGLATFWAVLIFLSALDNPNVTFTGCVWIMFVAVAHIASTRSLAKDVVLRVPSR
jgi:hypothetical protein